MVHQSVEPIARNPLHAFHLYLRFKRIFEDLSLSKLVLSSTTLLLLYDDLVHLIYFGLFSNPDLFLQLSDLLFKIDGFFKCGLNHDLRLKPPLIKQLGHWLFGAEVRF
jgi:hypothetical protein